MKLFLEQAQERKFNTIYSLYEGLIYTISRSILKDKELAKDAIQECCIRIYKNLDCFEDVESRSSRSLVSIIARNAGIDLLRKIKKQQGCETVFEEYMIPAHENDIDAFIKHVDRDGLQKYASMLEDRYASVLILKYYYEFTYYEIGSLLGITESNARVRMCRAKDKLADMMKKGAICNNG